MRHSGAAEADKLVGMTLTQRYWARKVQFTFGDKTFTCTRRTRGALRQLARALKKWHPGCSIHVFQPCYNTGVALSEGTHDFDAVLDIWINGMTGDEAQTFVRKHGWAGWHRTPAQGFVEHVHMALLPPLAHAHPTPQMVGQAYWRRGLKVGRYIDGGLTSQGVTNSTSQVTDYMANPPRDATSDHNLDRSWHPTNILATIYRPKGY